MLQPEIRESRVVVLTEGRQDSIYAGLYFYRAQLHQRHHQEIGVLCAKNIIWTQAGYAFCQVQ